MSLPDPRHRTVPLRALALSFAALVVPVVGALLFADSLGENGAILWLVPLIPAFLLAYYKGWRGVAVALALGMATLSVTQAVATWWMVRIPDTLPGIVIAYLAITMGIGLLAEFLHRDRDVVEDMAFTDLLTRLPNRRHALLFLENEFAAAQRGRLLSVVLFDLDGFKRYNDTHGHQAGDEAIKAFSDILARTTRRMNLSARFGGEEYISVLAGSDADGAVVFAERVRAVLESQHIGDAPLTVSAGVATFEPGMLTSDDLVAAADAALYQAKREGRNRVILFSGSSEDLEPARTARQAMESRRSQKASRIPDPALVPGTVGELGAGKRALVVEKDRVVRDLLGAFLRSEGFHVVEVEDVPGAVHELRTEFDVVVTDLRLSTASGREVVVAAKERWPATQVVVITGIQDAQGAGEALGAGADRYLFKPFGMPEFRSHLVDALARREQLQARARDRAEDSEAARIRADQARESILRGAMALVMAAEVRDPYTRGHSARVGAYSAVLAPGLDPGGELIDRERLELACELHDVGKIGVPDAILNKEGPLDEDEMCLVRLHPEAGRRILEPLLDDDLVLAVTHWHHERWDGTGYPDGLRGENIPPAARVVALADALDAMTCPRAYRDALAWEDALDRIRTEAGKGFDPVLVTHMETVLPQLKRVHEIGERSLAAARQARERAS